METLSFATNRRGLSYEAAVYAQSLLNKGYGYQNTARIVGVSEITLRDVCAAPKPRPERSRPLVSERTKALRQEPPKRSPEDVTRSILSRVCQRYGIPMRELMGRSQVRRLAWPRQEAMAMLWGVCGHTHCSIGEMFGRDHSTVCTSIQRYEERAAWCEVLTAFASFSNQITLFDLLEAA